MAYPEGVRACDFEDEKSSLLSSGWAFVKFPLKARSYDSIVILA